MRPSRFNTGSRFAVALVLAASLARVQLRADEEEYPDAEAATELIESLQGALGDLSAIRALPPQQRVDWVLNQASERVQAKVIDGAKDQLKEAMDDYAKAAFRAKAFQEVAVPALKNAAILGAPVDWTLLEARMASEVDTRVRAYGAAVTGVTIVWDSVEAFSSQGAQAGFSKLASGVYDAVAGAYIPGWGWFKLGATMVEALGNYVLGYATDTAMEGMLNDLFNMKGDPKGFAQMLRTTPLPDVYAKVEDGWELVAYGRLWNGQGTDAGDDAMKQKLKDTLYSLKAGIAHEVAEQEKKDAALRAQFQPHLDAAAQAEAKLKALAAKAKADAQPMLDAIRAFQLRAGELREEQAREEALYYEELAESGPGEPLPYTPLSRDVLALYTAAYSRVSETPGGSFDAQALSDGLVAANNAWAQVMAAQVEPPDGAGKVEWLAHRDADKRALMNEIQILRHEADQRAEKLAQAIGAEALPLAAQLREAAERLEQGLSALENEAAENLQQPDTFQRYGYPGFTENWLNGRPFHYDYMNFWIAPADNYAQMAAFLEKLEADRETLASLNARRRQLYADFYSLIQGMNTDLESLIPDGCQDFTETPYGSDQLRRTWSINYYYYPALPLSFPGLPLSALYVRPELVQSEFDAEAAITAIRARMAELEDAYNLAQLQRALQRVVEMLQEKLQPFTVASASSHAYSLMGRVNGLLDYRQPIDRTDLALYLQRFEPVWLAAQTRIELLQRHPTLVDAAPLLKYGVDLTKYQTLLAADQEERQRAPGYATDLMATKQQAVDRWTPIYLEMNPDYYEDALGGLGATLADAQRDLLRARSWSSPVYTLLVDELEAYIPEVTNLIHQAQTEYARITPWYFKTMPQLTASTSRVQATVGQSIQVTFQASEPNGTFSSPNLPAGLTLNESTGTVAGAPGQVGSFDVVVRYLAPSGISSRSMIHLDLAPPLPSSQALTIRDGYPQLDFHATPGVSYALQTRESLGDDERWVTVQTLSSTSASQAWTDLAGFTAAHRFYRIVWVPQP